MWYTLTRLRSFSWYYLICGSSSNIIFRDWNTFYHFMIICIIMIICQVLRTWLQDTTLISCMFCRLTKTKELTRLWNCGWCYLVGSRSKNITFTDRAICNHLVITCVITMMSYIYIVRFVMKTLQSFLWQINIIWVKTYRIGECGLKVRLMNMQNPMVLCC